MSASDGRTVTPRGHRILPESIEWQATRSGGPGGQHANTSDTAVTVTVHGFTLVGLKSTIVPVYVVVTVGEMVTEPLIGGVTLPMPWSMPRTLYEAKLLVCHERVVCCPDTMVDCPTERVQVGVTGAGGLVIVTLMEALALPPRPLTL